MHSSRVGCTALLFFVLLLFAMSSGWERVRLRMETVQNMTFTPQHLSTHILDTSIGRAVPNISVTLYRLEADKTWLQLNQSVTDNDGRIKQLINAEQFFGGLYKLHFETQPYFKARSLDTFYPFIEIVIECLEGQSYHVPLLLNAFGYSTYRGT